MRRKPNRYLSKLEFAYRIIFTLAAISFTIATIFTLPIFEADYLLSLFKQFFSLSSILMIVAELLELITNPVPRWTFILCALSVIGYGLYIWCLSIYPQFNNGEFYILATFIVSFSSQLKVLSLVVADQKKLKFILQDQKNRMIQLACVIAGSIFFMGGAAIQILKFEEQIGRLCAGVANLLSGIAIQGAVYAIHRPQKYKGYAKFGQVFQIPSIV